MRFLVLTLLAAFAADARANDAIHLGRAHLTADDVENAHHRYGFYRPPVYAYSYSYSYGFHPPLYNYSYFYSYGHRSFYPSFYYRPYYAPWPYYYRGCLDDNQGGAAAANLGRSEAPRLPSPVAPAPEKPKAEPHGDELKVALPAAKKPVAKYPAYGDKP